MQTDSIRAFQAERIVVAKAFARNSKKAYMVAVDLDENRDEWEEDRTLSVLLCRPF